MMAGELQLLSAVATIAIPVVPGRKI